MFIDRFVKQWREARLAAAEAEVAKFPLFDSKFIRGERGEPKAANGTFSQKLDHETAGDTRTFTQRYWVNSTYAAGKDSPVIYYICGESRCSGSGGFAVQLAKEMKGYAVTLEHRYYGDSVPTADYSADNLKYLSVEQALADMEAFKAFLVKDQSLTGQWITVGGSYAGAMSAYYRLKHPDSIAFALASSGPVQAKASFEEYDHQVATVVPAACLAAMQKVTAEIERDLATPASRESVKKLFGSVDVADDVDFLYIVADMAAIAIQYGSRDSFCQAIQTTGDAKAAYAKIGLQLFDDFGMTTMEDTAQGNMSVDPNQYRKNGMRQWLYQSCTQFGFWQVAYHDPKESSRSARIDLPFHNEICHRMFGITGEVDTNPINQNYFQPILDGKITKTFFTNGSDDPWQHLSINPARRNVPGTVEAMLIPGAAHCDDLGGPANASVVAAQDKFRALAKTWAEPARTPPAPPSKNRSVWPKVSLGRN